VSVPLVRLNMGHIRGVLKAYLRKKGFSHCMFSGIIAVAFLRIEKGPVTGNIVFLVSRLYRKYDDKMYKN